MTQILPLRAMTDESALITDTFSPTSEHWTRGAVKQMSLVWLIAVSNRQMSNNSVKVSGSDLPPLLMSRNYAALPRRIWSRSSVSLDWAVISAAFILFCWSGALTESSAALGRFRVDPVPVSPVENPQEYRLTYTRKSVYIHVKFKHINNINEQIKNKAAFSRPR